MHLKRLKLLRLMVKEQMHLQENTVFDLDLGVKVTQDVVQHPLHHVTYTFTKFDVAMLTVKEMHLRKIQYLTLMLPSSFYTVYIMTYAHVKIEVATSNSLGGDAFTRKFII